jgi:dTDP-4-dehydrorhamnose reductase
MRILITGGMGFFGVNAARWLLQRGHEIALGSSTAARWTDARDARNARDASSALSIVQMIAQMIVQMDVTQPAQIQACVDSFRPDAVIHAAALSQPLVCEREPERAFAVNAVGTRNLVEALPPQVRAVLLSTDLVFDGVNNTTILEPSIPPRYYTETSTPNARIIYGQSKIAAERTVLEGAFNDTLNNAQNWLVVRSALMFGNSTSDSNGFPHFAVNALRAGETTTLFTDQYRTPVWTDDLAAALELLLQPSVFSECAADGDKRIFHCGGAERINRVDFVQRFCAAAGVDTRGIRAVPMSAVPSYTTRVPDVALDSGRLRALGWQPHSLDEAFAAMLLSDDL